jgi:hypothetical protein
MIDVGLEVGIELSGGEERKKNTQEPSLSGGHQLPN